MNSEWDIVSSKSNDERVGGVYENSGFSGRRSMVNSSDGSENDVKSNASYSSRRDNRRVLLDRAEKEFEGLKLKHVDESRSRRSGRNPERRGRDGIELEGFRGGQGVTYNERKTYLEEGPGNYHRESSYGEGFKNERFRGDQQIANARKKYPEDPGNYYRESSYGEGFENERFRGDQQIAYARKKYPESSYGDGFENEGFRGGPRIANERMKYPASKYPEEGPGNYYRESSYSDGIGNQGFRNYPEEGPGNYYPESNYREGFENEGFRKVPASKFPEEGPENYYPESSYRKGFEKEGFRGDKQTIHERRKYPASKYSEDSPRNYYLESSYREGFENEGFRKLPSSKYPEESPRNYYPESSYGEPINYNQAELLRELEDLKDQLRRSGQGNVPNQSKKVHHDYEDSFSDSSSMLNRPFTNVPRPYMNQYAESSASMNMNETSDHLRTQMSHRGPKSMVSMDSFEGYPNSRNLQSHSRWPSDHIDSEASNFVPQQPPKPLKSERLCCPIVGGAPFITCYNCSQLLQVPNKISVKNGPKKLKCGSCETTMILGISNKRLIFSLLPKGISANANPNHIVTSKDDSSNTRSQINQTSKDYDHSASDLQEPVSHLTEPLSSAKSVDTGSHRSTYSLPENEVNLNDSNHVEYSNQRTEQEMMMPRKTISEQNYMKDVSEATEIEISSNEYSNTGTSMESGEASREGNQFNLAQSLYGGMTNEPERKVYPEKANVTVNGHLIPDSVIQKAEKFAGPIQLGHYWYDFRAGFWGVMGGPCLGVIPPFIEEFNYPMLENCAGGNTNVFVNGRELHQKDYNLLVSRGLPSERNRCFIVEISGRVLDEYTGEELESLGKLAPSVERAKRGFGMKPPKAAS